ncbi:hypothetical protein CB1_000290009 [Camelus ferus]|nr:hypothetical protein CB1_000290009 [Camelus ferus]
MSGRTFFLGDFGVRARSAVGVKGSRLWRGSFPERLTRIPVPWVLGLVSVALFPAGVISGRAVANQERSLACRGGIGASPKGEDSSPAYTPLKTHGKGELIYPKFRTAEVEEQFGSCLNRHLWVVSYLSVFTPVGDLALEVTGWWVQCCVLKSYDKLKAGHYCH